MRIGLFCELALAALVVGAGDGSGAGVLAGGVAPFLADFVAACCVRCCIFFALSSVTMMSPCCAASAFSSIDFSASDQVWPGALQEQVGLNSVRNLNGLPVEQVLKS